jgi:hypothetical protein
MYISCNRKIKRYFVSALLILLQEPQNYKLHILIIPELHNSINLFHLSLLRFLIYSILILASRQIRIMIIANLGFLWLTFLSIFRSLSIFKYVQILVAIIRCLLSAQLLFLLVPKYNLLVSSFLDLLCPLHFFFAGVHKVL